MAKEKIRRNNLAERCIIVKKKKNKTSQKVNKGLRLGVQL